MFLTERYLFLHTVFSPMTYYISKICIEPLSVPPIHCTEHFWRSLTQLLDRYQLWWFVMLNRMSWVFAVLSSYPLWLRLSDMAELTGLEISSDDYNEHYFSYYHGWGTVILLYPTFEQFVLLLRQVRKCSTLGKKPSRQKQQPHQCPSPDHANWKCRTTNYFSNSSSTLNYW